MVSLFYECCFLSSASRFTLFNPFHFLMKSKHISQKRCSLTPWINKRRVHKKMQDWRTIFQRELITIFEIIAKAEAHTSCWQPWMQSKILKHADLRALCSRSPFRKYIFKHLLLISIKSQEKIIFINLKRDL